MIQISQVLLPNDRIVELSKSRYPSTSNLSLSILKLIYSRPTVEARTNIYAGAKRKAEEIRVQIRKQHGTSIKKGKYEKHSIELEEVRNLVLFPVVCSNFCQFQKLTDKYVKETDLILANLQKATGAK